MKFKEGDRCTYNTYCGTRFLAHTAIIVRISGLYATVRRLSDGVKTDVHVASLY